MSSKISRASMFGLGVLVIVYSVGSNLLAQTAPAPEIDGGSIVTGVGLLQRASWFSVRGGVRSSHCSFRRRQHEFATGSVVLRMGWGC